MRIQSNLAKMQLTLFKSFPSRLIKRTIKQFVLLTIGKQYKYSFFVYALEYSAFLAFISLDKISQKERLFQCLFFFQENNFAKFQIYRDFTYMCIAPKDKFQKESFTVKGA